MDGTALGIVALIVAGAVAVIVPYLYLSPGRALRKRFVALGSLKGRTRRGDRESRSGSRASRRRCPTGGRSSSGARPATTSRSCSRRTAAATA